MCASTLNLYAHTLCLIGRTLYNEDIRAVLNSSNLKIHGDTLNASIQMS